MTHILKASLTVCIILAVALLAPLQAGWFDKFKDVINTDGKNSSSSSLTDNEIAGALKDALSIGSENVVSQLSAPGGFNSDASIRIPLPDSLQTVQKTMNKFGMGSSLNSLENKLNEAAELATDKAKPLFLNAIKELSWSDVKNILNGPDDAATQYFKAKMSSPLSAEMKPIVDNSLNEVGAINTYNNAMGKYKALPLVPDVQADLSQHVLDKGIDGIFYYLAAEEKAIRENPAKRTTDLLKKVFAK
tara:strand:- start:530 stop:1270 length:741 start_codon:yes stop_codon:yes gene_type:complete